MALTLNISRGGRFRVGKDIWFRLLSISAPTKAEILDEKTLQIYHVSDEKKTLIYPGVGVQMGKNNSRASARLTFFAPKSIQILRGELV